LKRGDVMATRPWVTPQEVKDYSENPRVTSRDDSRLKVDILRAEQRVIAITGNRFDDADEFPEIPLNVKTAVMLLAEMYAIGAAGADANSGNFRSESFDDYSYTLHDTESKIDNIDIEPLLADYIVARARNPVNMSLRKL